MKNYEIGEIIKKGLEKKHMEQKVLAEKLDLEPSTISRWTKGKSIPDANTFLNTAEILEIDVNGLMKTKLEEDQEKRLLQIYGMVRNTDDRDVIIKIIQLMVPQFDK